MADQGVEVEPDPAADAGFMIPARAADPGSEDWQREGQRVVLELWGLCVRSLGDTQIPEAVAMFVFEGPLLALNRGSKVGLDVDLCIHID